MSTKEREAQLVEILRAWQQIENRSVQQATAIIERTRNPVIQLVMELIRHDSTFHHRVQQFLIESLETQAVTLSVEELAGVWDGIEAHIESERRVGELVASCEKALAGTKGVVQQYLLAYLANDERKHDRLLEDLALIKRGIYKSA